VHCPHEPRLSVAASEDTWRTEMKCAFPGPTATRCCSCSTDGHTPRPAESVFEIAVLIEQDIEVVALGLLFVCMVCIRVVGLMVVIVLGVVLGVVVGALMLVPVLAYFKR